MTLSTTEHGTPSSIAFGSVDMSQAVVSFAGGETVLYDLHTEQSIMVLETQTKDGEQHEIKRLVVSVYIIISDFCDFTKILFNVTYTLR